MSISHRRPAVSSWAGAFPSCATSILALAAMIQPAHAGCSGSNVTPTNATLTNCSSNAIYATPNTGASSLTVDGVSSPGIVFSPTTGITSGTFTETLTLRGASTFDTTAGQSDPNGGATVNMVLQPSGGGGSGVILNSTVIIGSGVTINAHARYGGAIALISEGGGGTLSITNAGTVTVLGINNDNTNTALNATSIADGSIDPVDGLSATTHRGGVTVINSGSVTANSGRGLYGDGNYSAVTLNGSGDVTATNGPAVTVSLQNSGTVNSLMAGLRAINYYGLASATNSGTVRSTERQALAAWSAKGDASITNSGTATADDRNAIHSMTENGTATITNSGTVTAAKLASGSLGASAGYSGLRATANYTGDVSITNTSSGTVTANSDAAIVAHTPQGNATITNQGAVTGLSGVFINNGAGTGSIDTLKDTTASGNNTITGTASLTNGGIITATNYGAYLDGTTNSLTNSGTLSSSAGTAVSLGTGGAGTITNSGTLKGSTAAINGRIDTLNNSGVIAGNVTNSGTGTLTVTGGSGGYGLLTGYNGGSASLSSPGAVGSFSNTGSDVALTSGQLWLNDNMALAGHTLSVGSGAELKISNPITVSGIYSQTGGGLTVTSSGILNLSNTYAATVRNTTITLYGTSLTAGSTYTLVNANAAGTYTDNALRIRGSYGLSGVLSTADNGNDLVVTLAPSNYTGKGTAEGGAAAGMGSALDAITASNSAEAQSFKDKVIVPLSDLPASQQQIAIKQLAPTQITPAVQAATQAAAPTTSVIEQHELAMLDGGERGISTGEQPHGIGVWGQAVGGATLRTATSNASGYRANNAGFVAGIDVMQPDGGVLGLAASWVRGWSWGTGATTGTSSTMNSYQLTGYGLHRLGAAFVDWQLGVGYNTYDQRRAIAFLSQQATAKYDGQQYLAKAGTGHDVDLGNGVTVTPMAGLRFLRAVNGGYTERGSDAGLSVHRRGVQSLTHDLGGKVAWKTESPWGKFTPELRLAWVHDYTQGPVATSGVMGGQTFVSTVARPSPDGVKMNLAMTQETQDGLDFRAEYEGEARPHYQSHTGLLKVRQTF